MRISKLSRTRADSRWGPSSSTSGPDSCTPAGPPAPRRRSTTTSHVDRLRLIRALLEVGHLSLADIQRVVDAIDLPTQDPATNVAMVQQAVSPQLAATTELDLEPARELVDELGWSIARRLAAPAAPGARLAASTPSSSRAGRGATAGVRRVRVARRPQRRRPVTDTPDVGKPVVAAVVGRDLRRRSSRRCTGSRSRTRPPVARAGSPRRGSRSPGLTPGPDGAAVSESAAVPSQAPSASARPAGRPVDARVRRPGTHRPRPAASRQAVADRPAAHGPGQRDARAGAPASAASAARVRSTAARPVSAPSENSAQPRPTRRAATQHQRARCRRAAAPRPAAGTSRAVDASRNQGAVSGVSTHVVPLGAAQARRRSPARGHAARPSSQREHGDDLPADADRVVPRRVRPTDSGRRHCGGPRHAPRGPAARRTARRTGPSASGSAGGGVWYGCGCAGGIAARRRVASKRPRRGRLLEAGRTSRAVGSVDSSDSGRAAGAGRRRRRRGRRSARRQQPGAAPGRGRGRGSTRRQHPRVEAAQVVLAAAYPVHDRHRRAAAERRPARCRRTRRSPPSECTSAAVVGSSPYRISGAR